jgi:hypothetical protein
MPGLFGFKSLPNNVQTLQSMLELPQCGLGQYVSRQSVHLANQDLVINSCSLLNSILKEVLSDQ